LVNREGVGSLKHQWILRRIDFFTLDRGDFEVRDVRVATHESLHVIG
jgi:hypothetical protein